MKTFGWPVDELIKQRKLLIIQPTLYNYEALLTKIEDAVNMIGAKRLGCTTIAIDETENENDLSAFHVEEFVVDGLIMMYFTKRDGHFERSIAIRKMRSTKHSHKIHPFDISSPGGVVVYPGKTANK